jgi:hypothetical protein
MASADLELPLTLTTPYNLTSPSRAPCRFTSTAADMRPVAFTDTLHPREADDTTTLVGVDEGCVEGLHVGCLLGCVDGAQEGWLVGGAVR